ncbi:ABC transporter substrate-binding protein [Bradyrhizobium sp. AZCC 2262]|uniref:ABC transporter substrate-binding protein n=1 Tax=Bradyrhizobium sp. AZCC 2262 TaxID=3117022 RepID=UPI002FF2B7C0
MSKSRLLRVLAVLGAICTTAAHAAPDTPAVDRETLVVALEKEFNNLDALVAVSGDSLRYGWQIYDTLYGFDQKGNLVPRIATGVDISEDAQIFTYRLRKGVKFHNGAELTAKDVKASVDHILKPENKSTRRPFFAPVVDAVETPDAYTVRFRLKVPDGAFANKVAGYLYIVPADYLASLPNAEAFAQAPVSAGPYKLKTYAIGGDLVLERFEDYWGEKPKIKTIIFKIIPEPSSRVNAILTGEVDLAVVVPLPDYDRLKKEKGLDVIANPVASPLYVRTYTNQPDSPFAKRDVRQALSYALDVNAIIKGVLHGVGEPVPNFISKYYPYGGDASARPYPYDPKKAKELLARAGYPNGFTTKLYSATDQPKELAEAIAAYWGQVGVKLEVDRIAYAAWTRLNNTHSSGPLSVTQFTNAIYDPIHPVAGSFTKEGTWSDYYNPEVEELIAEVNRTADNRQRNEIFKKVGKVLHDDAAGFFISELYYVFAKKQSLDWEVQIGSGFLNFRQVGWR